MKKVIIIFFIALLGGLAGPSLAQDPRPPSRPGPGDCRFYDPFCSPLSPLAEPESKVFLPIVEKD